MSPFQLVSNIATISGLLIILIIVSLKGIRNKVYQGFLGFAAVLLLYIVASFFSQFPHSVEWGLTWSRTALAIANFAPIPFLIFTKYFTGYKNINKFVSYSVYIIPILLAPLAFSSYAISKVSYSSYGIMLNGTGPFLWVTLAYFAGVFGYCFWLFSKHVQESSQSTKSQIKLITWSTGLVVGLNLITQIALPEFHLAYLGNVLGNPTILLFVSAIGYAILRQKLFDIRTAVLRTVVFVITLFMTVIVFAVGMFAPIKFLFKSLTLSHEEEIYFILAGVTLALLYRPLSRLLEKITDKVFYQDRYDSSQIVSEVGQILSSEIDLDKLCQKIKATLSDSLRVNELDIIVLDKGKVFYEAADYFKSVRESLVVDLETLGDQLLVSDELYGSRKKVILQKYGINVFEVLRTRDEKVGYLLFSEKLNGTAYNITDTKLIEIVSDELAIAIQNSRAYTQIQKFNADLQKRIDEATLQLRNANQKLTQQDSVKNDFISMISHQLGTPLSVMDGFLSLTLKGFYGKIEGKMKETLEKTLSRTRMMERLTFDLLNISRMTAGKFFLELSETDMAKIVPEEVEELHHPAQDKNVKLTYHPPTKSIPKLMIDEPKTRQAVMNLVNNAVFYAPDGNVDVYLDTDGHNVIFKVMDTGIGVPDDQKPMLFTKFFRADNARKESPNGTGIGLYLVKRIVTDQHGQIIFHSQVGKGSTFGFTLPVNTPVTVVSSPAPVSAEKTEKIMV